MSKHQVWSDIASMNFDELEDQYDITIYEDGAVYDNLEAREFVDLSSWAEFTVAQELETNYGGVSKMNSKYAYEDDF